MVQAYSLSHGAITNDVEWLSRSFQLMKNLLHPICRRLGVLDILQAWA